MNSLLLCITIQDITSIINCLVVILAVLYAYRQYNITKIAKRDDTLLKSYEFLQKDDFINARGIVQKTLNTKPFATWSEQDIKSAEKVCRDYDTVFLMNSQLGYDTNTRIIAVKWNHSIIKSFTTCIPLIEKYRKERGEGFWNHFEKLYFLAKKMATDDTDDIMI